MLVASARSFLGKYSAVTLMAAGKLPLSPIANTIRQTMKSQTLVVAMASAIVLPASTRRKASTLSSPWMCIVSHPQPACKQAPRLQTKMAMR